MQVKVLAMHASGMTLKQISDEIFVSYSGVTNYAHRAKRRLGCGTLAAAVIRAHQLGYLSHPTGAELAVLATG